SEIQFNSLKLIYYSASLSGIQFNSLKLISIRASLSGIPFNSLKLIYYSAGLSGIQFNSLKLIYYSASLSGIPFNSLKLIYFSAGLSEIQFNSLKFPRIMGSGAQIILKRKGDLMMHERMPHWLTRQAFLAPDKLALEMPGGDAWTFTTLRNESELFARKLAQLSIQQRDKVAILSNNHLDAVRAIFACYYLGVVAVMLNTRLTQQELH